MALCYRGTSSSVSRTAICDCFRYDHGTFREAKFLEALGTLMAPETTVQLILLDRPPEEIRGLTVAVSLTVSLRLIQLDSARRTGIRRLTGYELAQQGKVKGPRIPPGGLWGEARIQLRLMNNRDFDIRPDTPRDAALQARLESILGGRNLSYGIALLDISDPAHPRYAASVRPTNCCREALASCVSPLALWVRSEGLSRSRRAREVSSLDCSNGGRFRQRGRQNRALSMKKDGGGRESADQYRRSVFPVGMARSYAQHEFQRGRLVCLETGDLAEALWKQVSSTRRGREGILRYDSKTGPRTGSLGNPGRTSAKFRYRHGEFPPWDHVHQRRLASDSRNRQLWYAPRVASLAGSYGTGQAG